MSEISILTVDGVSFNLSDDKARGSLSEVEMTPRASKTYAVGDYLIYQGRFYKVVQVIDQDSFFEIGTNIIPVTVGEELELKARLETPTFSGSPKVPTADVGTRTTQIASTAYVQSELDSVKERIQSVQNGLDGIDANIGDRVTAVAASTTTAWMNAHITNTNTVLLDTSLTVEGAAADAKAVGDAIDELPKIVNTDEEGADFDLADRDGNVLVRFEDGHIKVKNFDSSTLSDSFDEKIDIQQDVSDVGKALVVGDDGKVSPADISIDVDTTLSIEGAVADAKAVGDALDALSEEIVDSIDELDSSVDNRITSLNEDITNIGNPPILKESEQETADLDVADPDGNVILRLENGHIKTKNFNSEQPPAVEMDTWVNNSDATNVDLDVADRTGKVVLRLENGHIKTKNFDSSQVKIPDDNNPIGVLKNGIGMLAVFDKVGCIGDSLASGECVYDGGAVDKYNISWGQIMARMNGNTCYNFSVGGLTTRSWLGRYVGDNPRDDSFLTNICDAYIIALGQNDSYSGDSRYVQLGTTSDIGTATDSFYGNLSRIITQIKTLQPRAKIFILTDPYETNETGGYNDAVRYIADHTQDCYLIDLYTYALNVAPHDRSDTALWRGGHLVATGYYQSAIIINTYIDWLIRHNLGEFKYIQFIGTEYDY